MKKTLLFLLLSFCFTSNKAQILNTGFCQTNAGGTVRAVAVDSVNNVVYIGGSFTSVCGQPRLRLAAMNATTGALLPWNPGANNDVISLYIHHHALYVGGGFTNTGGQSRMYAAKYYIPSGTLAGWQPAITTGFEVMTIVGSGSKIYLGGNFFLTVSTGQNLCELDTGNALATSWPVATTDNTVRSLSVEGNTLYIGGNFTNIGSVSQNYLAKATIPSGALSAWNPSPDGNVTAVLAQSGQVFISGGFTFINGSSRPGLANIDTSTGFATSWNPGSDLGATQLTYRKGILYAVGNFSVIGGKSRPYAAAIDVNTGVAARWNVQAGGSIFSAATTPTQIYLGGGMGTILGQTRNNFAVVCINPIDTMTNAPDGPITVCNGVTAVSYSVAPVNGATTYSWTYSGTGSTIHGNSNAVTVDFSNTATSGDLTVRATNGCETSNTQTLSINTYSFTASVSPNTNNITCGDSVDINSSDNYAGSGSITYSWTPSTGLNATNVSGVKSGAKTTITYTLTETSSEGCVAKDNTTITVSPFNLLTSSLTASILCSTTDSLHVTNDYPGLGTVTYTWSPSTSVSLPHGANTSANPVVSTDYTVTASATGGCTASLQTIFVSVDPISLSAGNTSGNITCGDATQLNANSNYPGAGTLTYTWSPSAGLNNANITNPIASPITTTTYTLTLTSPEGCVSTDQTTINVNSLQVNVTNTVSAGCHSPVTLSTNANSSNSNLVYSWTPSGGLNNVNIASPTAVVGINTTYSVTMSLPSSGCSDATNSVNISLANPNGPSICMVTVDSASTHNVVYWDKTGLANASIDSFRIYREVTTGVYQIVGTVLFSSLSEFHDYAANPNITTYRYKISALDSCGLESALSLYHNTVYIISVGGGQYTWNPGYTIEPTTNPVNNYLLMRDDNNVGLWHQVQSTSGSQNTIADPSWASYPNANWQVVTAWNISCSPTAKQSNGTQAAIVKSKSNISNNRPMGIKNAESNFSVYPNPTNGNLTISFTNSTQGKVSVKIMSAIGQEVYGEAFTQTNENHTIDLSKYQNGIYLVQITTNNSSVIKRIVKN